MKRCKFRHRLFKWIVIGGTRIYCRLKLGFKADKNYKLEKDKGAIILCNHQTDFDPVMVSTVFNRPIYFVCTDTVYTKPLLCWFVNRYFACIPKHKGTVDTQCVRGILQTIKEKGVVGIFPEGNRNIAEFQFEIDASIAKLIKKSNVDLILYNLEGGNKVYPRFAPGPRKGKIKGTLKRIVKPEEYNNMSDEELTKLICDTLRVYDSESSELIKTDAPAEYLERLLFVCPKCGAVQSISTSGSHVKCSKCGLDVEFDETLHFKSNDPEFKYNILNEWYEFQKKYVRELEIGDGVIFEDENVSLYTSKPYEARKLLSTGSIKLTKDALIFYDTEFNVHNIEIASYISGVKFNFTVDGNTYLVEGNERFNALKYVFMFNKLDTLMKQNQTDHYFNIE